MDFIGLRWSSELLLQVHAESRRNVGTNTRYTQAQATSTVVTWLTETEKSFTLSKIQLAKYTVLNFPSVSAHLFVVVDASSMAVGAVLQQAVDDNVEAIVFYVRGLPKSNGSTAHFCAST